jgi:hypothetical protein
MLHSVESNRTGDKRQMTTDTVNPEPFICVTMKDGTKEHFSPATEIIIDNGHHEYRIKADEIAKIETYFL